MKIFYLKPLSLAIILSLTFSGCKKKEVPVLETSPITEILGTSAKCGGNIIDDGGETVLSRGVCWSTDINPSIKNNKTSDGAGAGSFTSTIANLVPATTFFVRAYATSSSGTGYGMVMSFKTNGEAPATTTLAVMNLTTTAARLSATVNANYLTTTVTFEYGLTSSYGSSAVAQQSPVTGNTATTVTADITGLAAGTTYHYRVKAENTLGTTYGNDQTIKTLGNAPIAVTQAATGLTTTTALLNGNVNANYLSTAVSFEYGLSTTYGSSIVATQSPVNGITTVNVNKSLTGLSAGTIYHYRVKAENSLGITYGEDKTFTTLGLVPTSITQTATNQSASSVTLNGNINANYLATTVTFEYGTTNAYGITVNAIQSPLSGSTASNVSANLTGLAPGTIYHYRVEAENSLGKTYGNDMTFTTLGQIPYASTQDATGLTSTSATLKGFVSAYFLSTSVIFEYGTTTSYGTVINASPNIVTGNSVESVSAYLSGLTTGATYHFRVIAENSLGRTYGADLTFVPSGSAPVSDVDGNTYAVVTIGTQTWMAENLRTTKYNDNTSIPLVTSDAAWVALATPGYCWYNNDEGSYKNPYGALYNWYAVNSGKLCPTGWHVPTDSEFTTLTDFFGGITIAGGKLKEVGTTHWLTPNSGATDLNGFSALPGGQRDESGSFIGLGQNGFYWTSTPYNIIKPWYRGLGYNAGNIFPGCGSLNIRGFSIRCMKD